METKFDIFFNLNDEDTYLVQNISQYFRDKGLKTFDRSVDHLPVSVAENLSENDALDCSGLMVYVLTENSYNDPSCLNLVDRANETGKRVIVMRFDGANVPESVSDDTIIIADRADLKPSLHRLEDAL